MSKLTLAQLLDYCSQIGGTIHISHDGTIRLFDDPSSVARHTVHSAESLAVMILASMPPRHGYQVIADAMDEDYASALPHVFRRAGYEELATVLVCAFEQAATGKGHERHANGEPFHRQVMQDMARRFGVGALLGQAFKKSEESQRLPLNRAVAELLGAINYLAGAVIALEARAAEAAANDNAATAKAERHG